MFVKITKFIIRGYQLALSPFLGTNCRFTPSCSQYALEAINEHGAAKGTMLAVKRLCRCHPFANSGYDPVPLKHHSPIKPYNAEV